MWTFWLVWKCFFFSNGVLWDSFSHSRKNGVWIIHWKGETVRMYFHCHLVCDITTSYVMSLSVVYSYLLSVMWWLSQLHDVTLSCVMALSVTYSKAVSAPDACDASEACDVFGHVYDATWIGFGSIFIVLRMRKKCLDQSGVRSVTWQGNLVWQGQLSPC